MIAGIHKITHQNFFSHPVVLELICYCMRVKRQIKESNTAEGLQKNIGNPSSRPKHFQPPSRIGVDLLSYDSKMTKIRGQTKRRLNFFWTGCFGTHPMNRGEVYEVLLAQQPIQQCLHRDWGFQSHGTGPHDNQLRLHLKVQSGSNLTKMAVLVSVYGWACLHSSSNRAQHCLSSVISMRTGAHFLNILGTS